MPAAPPATSPSESNQNASDSSIGAAAAPGEAPAAPPTPSASHDAVDQRSPEPSVPSAGNAAPPSASDEGGSAAQSAPSPASESDGVGQSRTESSPADGHPQTSATPDGSAPPAKRKRRRRRRRKPADGTEGQPEVVAAEQASRPPGNDRAPAERTPRPPKGPGSAPVRNRPARGGDGAGSRRSRSGKAREGQGRPARGGPAPAQPAESKAHNVVGQALERETGKTEPRPAVDAPLTETDKQEFQRNLRFLRDHRKELKLKLNAQEDLLLNGAKEPESRGVCDHLLAKVDYTLVATASARMPPQQRIAFVEGVLRFKSELPFLLLYLEGLKDGSPAEAANAVTHALRHLDYRDVSQGQMGRLLELVVDVLSETERPHLLLSLLESKSFRATFDGALDKLPPSLAAHLAPMRAVHGAILRGQGTAGDAGQLTRGVRLVLESGRGFERRPAAVRARLLEHALHHIPADSKAHRKGIEQLINQFKESDDNSGGSRADEELGSRSQRFEMLLIAGLMRVGADQDAKRRLEKLKNAPSPPAAASVWLRALTSPRFGRIAHLKTKGGGAGRPSGMQTGFCLDTQRRVWLRLTREDDEGALARNLETVRKALVPSVVQPYATGMTHKRKPYAAFLRSGALASQRLQATRRLPRETILRIAEDGVLIVCALAQAGIQLPDAQATRFELDSGDRLWLLDLWGATAVTPAEATATMIKVAARWTAEVLLTNPSMVVESELAAALAEPADFPTLLAGLRRVGQAKYAG